MAIISCGECNNMIYLIIGSVSKFVLNFILYLFPDGAELNKHPFILGINAGIGMSLAIIPYLFIFSYFKEGKINIVFLNIFTFMLYKIEIYKHQYFSSIIIILLGIILNVINLRNMKLSDLPILFLSIIIEIAYSLAIV